MRLSFTGQEIYTAEGTIVKLKRASGYEHMYAPNHCVWLWRNVGLRVL